MNRRRKPRWWEPVFSDRPHPGDLGCLWLIPTVVLAVLVGLALWSLFG